MQLISTFVKLGALGVALAGCVQQHFHYARDGLRVDQDPARLGQFEIDKAICNGEAAKANLTQTANALLVATSVELVYRGCMAGKGYVVR